MESNEGEAERWKEMGPGRLARLEKLMLKQ